MDLEQARHFRILSEEEFNALTTSEKAEYLRNAIAARNAINRQIDASIIGNLPKEDS